MSASPAAPVDIRDLASYDGDLVDRLHRDVLAVSFSPEELDDADTLARGLRGDGDTDVLVSVAVSGEQVLGGVVGEMYAREQVLLLSYLAVRPDQRGNGLGMRLMERAATWWSSDRAVRLAIAEVHDPRSWSGVGNDDPVSRLRFFERVGARVLDLQFVQPAVRAGRARVPGFFLLAFHVDSTAEVRHDGATAVRSDLVSRFVCRYYETAEDVRAPYDTQLAHLLEQVEEHPTIRLLPIAEYDRVPQLA